MKTYLRTRWIEGERNSVGLWRELRAQGYNGSRMTVERFLLGLRAMEQQGRAISKAATTTTITPHRAVGFMLRRDHDLSEEEKRAFAQGCQVHPSVNRAYSLLQQFVHMTRSRRGEELEW